MSENNEENLDELERQLQESLNEIRRKKAEIEAAKRKIEEEERLKKEEEERIKREELYQKQLSYQRRLAEAATIFKVWEVTDFNKVIFTVSTLPVEDINGVIPDEIDNIRRDIASWLRGTFVVQDYKHKDFGYCYAVEATAWKVVVHAVSTFKNTTIEYNQDSEKAIQEAIDAPHFVVDEHPEGFKVIINPTAEYYASDNIRSIPGSKPVAGTHNKEWIVPFIYSFMLIQKLNEQKVKFKPAADERIKTELALRDLLDSIAKQADAPEIEAFFKNDTVPRAFQRVGVKFGIQRDGNFILSDEMGLGKTLQDILLGVYLAKKYGDNYRELKVCPAGLKENWYRELYKLLGIEAVVMSGKIPDENDMITLLVKKPKIVIINYDLVASKVEIKGIVTERKNADGSVEKVKGEDKIKWPWVELINACEFSRITYDEAHKLKNPESNRSQASRLISIPRVTGITGTPITNRPQEYWTLLKLIAPKEMPNYEQFTGRYVSADGKRAANVEELRHLVKPFMIRRTKKEVVADLPAIIRQTVYHTLSEKARPIYAKAEAGLYQIIRAFNPAREGEDELINSVLTEILRLKQICAWDKIEATVDLGVATLDSYEPDELNNKLIIFTQFVDLVEEIRKRISGDFGTVAFTGETPMNKRYDMCDRFQTDPAIRVLVTTMKTASEGLTLTRAGAVIFNDFGWTPAEHEQAEARCYGRLNDMHGARSYYHAAANTIEDFIQELLLRKMSIIEQIVDGVAIARDEDTSILKEIIKKIKGG